MPSPEPTIAVIGAGIAGLTAAFRLQQHGRRVAVFEAEAVAGGVIRSERTGGYLVEHGPNALQARSPAFEALVQELDLAEARMEADPAAQKRFVVRDGVPLALPSSPPGLITSKVFSTRAKLRLLREPFVRPAPAEAEESVADFVRRRLGREVLDYGVNPFVAGIYAGDPERLALRHAFPRLRRLEQDHGSLVKGMLAKARAARTASPPTPKGHLFSFQDGLETLPRALAAHLGDALHLNARVTRLTPSPQGWHLSLQNGSPPRPFDALLYAAPLHALSALHIDTPVDVSPLTAVPYPPVSIVALGYQRGQVVHPLDGFGLLVPEREQDFSILGTLFSSSLFPGRAPAGHVLLTTFVGGTRHPDLALADPPVLQQRVERDLQHLLGISGVPAFARQVHWPRAIPQYECGYEHVHRTIERLEAHHNGFFMAGNYRQGISVLDALDSGEAAAERIAAFLGA